MRIQFPKDVCDALDTCEPYLVCDWKAKRTVVKEDAPQEIKDLYKKTVKRMDELEEEWRRDNW